MQKLSPSFVQDMLLRRRANPVLIAASVAFFAFIFVSCATEQRTAPLVDDTIARAFASRASDVQVEGEGKVIRVLADGTNDLSFSLRRDRRC